MDEEIHAATQTSLEERFWELGRELGITDDRIQAALEKIRQTGEEIDVEHRARSTEEDT